MLVQVDTLASPNGYAWLLSNSVDNAGWAIGITSYSPFWKPTFESVGNITSVDGTPRSFSNLQLVAITLAQCCDNDLTTFPLTPF